MDGGTKSGQKGKEDVLCSVCGQKMRKDTVQRHWSTQHKSRLSKGEKPSWKLETKGVSSLEKHGFVQRSNVKVLEVKDNEDNLIDESTSDFTDNNNSNVEGYKDKAEEFKSIEEPPTKKVRYDDLEMFMDRIEKKVDSMKDDLKNKIDEKFHSLITSSDKRSLENAPVQALPDDLGVLVLSCKSID